MFKRTPWLLLVLLSSLVVLVTPGGTRASSGSWFSQGSGTVVNQSDFAVPVTERWQWVASSNVGTLATGAAAKGHFSATIASLGYDFDADVTCLNVDGNAARIGITVTRSNNPRRPTGAHTWITMTSIGQGLDALHLVGADGSNAVPPVCPPPSGARDPFQGVINVRSEATPYGWLAQGAGHISFAPTQDWQWVALSDVGGGNARGHLTVRDSATGVGYDADVACLTVSGASARIGLLIKQSTDPNHPTGMATYIHMTTTGQGNSQVNQLLPDGGNYPAVDPLTFRPIACTAPVPGGYPFDGTMNLRG